MSERNKDLVRTAEKLREVLQIAGENAGSLHEVEVSERDEMRAAQPASQPASQLASSMPTRLLAK
jgi:hypothetical protein